MNRYLRFQTAVRSRFNRLPLGVFRAAGQLRRLGFIERDDDPLLSDALAWFNENLRVPDLRDEHHRAVFWFRTEARELVGRAWDIVIALRVAGILVELRRTDDPGKIIYEDQHQVAAIRRRRPRDGWRRRIRIVRFYFSTVSGVSCGPSSRRILAAGS
jgi:hypothetical protein